MPSSDYSNAVGGGLKLKGARVEKKKKKTKAKPGGVEEATAAATKRAATLPEETKQTEEEQKTSLQQALADEDDELDRGADQSPGDGEGEGEGEAGDVDVDVDVSVGVGAKKPHDSSSSYLERKEDGRTETQRRFEERRRRRLDERLKREGVLTHKERVQQLNKYLSTLSEHNDMPRIGPG